MLAHINFNAIVINYLLVKQIRTLKLDTMYITIISETEITIYCILFC